MIVQPEMKSLREVVAGDKQVELVAKTQLVRLTDVFVLGPTMLWASAQKEPLPGWARSFLFYTGIATIVYNLYNYELQARVLEAAKEKEKGHGQ